jgi:hypothetical protein
MSEAKKALLLIGSGKINRSTSEVLGSYILTRLSERGYTHDTIFAHKLLKSDERMAEMLSLVSEADLVILAFPLYVDCLPYAVINALERIADDRRNNNVAKRQRFMAIINCGFPDSYHNDTALAICKQFARETGFDWVGALSMGGGEAISGRELAKAGRVAKYAIKSLDLAADSLANDELLPQKAIDLMAKRSIPRWLYVFIGGLSWKSMAKKFGVKNKLKAKPYQQT